MLQDGKDAGEIIDTLETAVLPGQPILEVTVTLYEPAPAPEIVEEATLLSV